MKKLLALVVVLALGWTALNWKTVRPMVVKVVQNSTLPEVEKIVELRQETNCEVTLAAARIPISSVLYEKFKEMWDAAKQKVNPVSYMKDFVGLTEAKVDASPEISTFRVSQGDFKKLPEGQVLTWRPTMDGFTPVWQGIWVKSTTPPTISHYWIDGTGTKHDLSEEDFKTLRGKIGTRYQKSEPGLQRYFRKDPANAKTLYVVTKFSATVYFDDPKTMSGVSLLGYELVSDKSEKNLRCHEFSLTLADTPEQAGKRNGRIANGENGFWVDAKSTQMKPTTKQSL